MNKYNVILIIGICILLLSIAGGAIWWWPALSGYMSLKEELNNRDIELEGKEAYFNGLKETLDRVKEQNEEIAKINSAFPEDLEVGVPTLLNFMKELSSKNGVIVDTLSGDPASLTAGASSGIEELPFSLSVSGTYASFKNFLSAIYRNARMIDVDSIRFGSSQEKEGLSSFDISLRTYFDTGSIRRAESVSIEEGKR
jgi:Tfp pilus assembly protein PilO